MGKIGVVLNGAEKNDAYGKRRERKNEQMRQNRRGEKNANKLYKCKVK